MDKLIPLTQIAKELNKKPTTLSKMARDGIITAVKQKNRWYGNKQTIKKELNAQLWNRGKYILVDNIEEIINILFTIIKLTITFIICYIMTKNFNTYFSEIILLTEKERIFISILSIPIIYFFIAFPKTLTLLNNANNIWKRLSLLESKTKNLKDEIEDMKT